jgi:hypothetical protein
MTFATIAGFIFGPIGRWVAIGLAAVALVIMVYRAGISAERARTALDACRLEVSGLRMRVDVESDISRLPDPSSELQREWQRP